MIRKATPSDQENILALYTAVAAVPGGLARSVQELSNDYIAGFMDKAAASGIEFVYTDDDRIIGEIHASGLGIAGFAHVLTDLTIAVTPDGQGRGIGRALFAALLAEVTLHRPQITRVELFVRESNVRARHLYTSLGFAEEGRLPGRVIDAHGQPEADLIMGWLRPASVLNQKFVE